MGTKWLSNNEIHRIELAVAERAKSELKKLDKRWDAEILDGGKAGEVRIATTFAKFETGPVLRVTMGLLPELWAEALHELFTHPSRESTREDKMAQREAKKA